MSRRLPESTRADFVSATQLTYPKLAVPAYFGPWEERAWSQLLLDRPAVVVINPANGPGTRPSPDYRRLTQTLQRQGSTVLAYVCTGYLQRPIDAMAIDVQRALEFFGVNGVFFDEIPVENTVRTRKILDALLALSPATCALNAGRSVPSTWFKRWPQASFVTFEGTPTQFEERFGSKTEITIDGPPDRQWMLVHSVALRSHKTYWQKLAEAGISLGYVTNDRLPNPWDVYVNTRP